ncbi:MAG: cell division protein FtsZ [Patescibacteria group bacterium]|nr:cell division protein FtsZ [Patescibacteria group bacterium]
MAEVKPSIEAFAKIKVVGVGGGGGSAINRMIESKIKGVDFIAMNTDIQALQGSRANKKLHLGKAITRGLGAGMDPEVGRKSAEENENEIRDVLKDSNMVFVTCGLGGGTGSGASPLVAEIARDLNALTVAVVTKPFSFEGAQRTDIAERAHELLSDRVDTVLTIPNDRILQITDKKVSLVEAFNTVDDVLRQGVQSISEIITIPGTTPGSINVDFNDVKTIMRDAGSALMGIGKASGENAAVQAAKDAIDSPLLDVSIEGAKGILLVIKGGLELGMHEISEAASIITSSADSNAKVVWGSIIDPGMKDEVEITVIATGFEMKEKDGERLMGQPSYSPSSFLKSSDVGLGNGNGNGNNHVPETPVKEEPKEVEMPDMSSLQQAPKPTEEEADIPAFIRRKLGK